jgi:hypothetical protein
MKRFTLTLGFVVLAGLVEAANVKFDNSWTEQRFSMFSSNDFALNGNSLEVVSDGTVSLLWTSVPESEWGKKSAKWNWSFDESVPVTNLSLRGGDDRNMSVYFIFLPKDVAQSIKNKGVKALMSNPDVRVLMYAWGGSYKPGQVIKSPYLGERGRTVALRNAGAGSASEMIDLDKDHQRAFGTAAQSLVGLAVSSDSDDTGAKVIGQISGLKIE